MLRVNFILIHHYNYSLTELENMVRFEREIYLLLLEEHIKEQKEEQQKRRQTGF